MSPRLLILGLALLLMAIFYFVRRNGDETESGLYSEGGSRAQHDASGRHSTNEPSNRLPSKSADRRPGKNGRSPLITTASGLQYQVLVEGSGPRPGPKDQVQVLYEGTTEDGAVFDSTTDRGASSFPLNAVIKGWQEGMQLMAVGSKYRFIIPPDLAYGERGAPPVIPSNAILSFEIELLKVTSPTVPQPNTPNGRIEDPR